MDRMLTIAEVAALVGVTPRRLQGWARTGKMPPPRWRRQKLTRYLSSDIETWMRGEWKPEKVSTAQDAV